MGTKPTTFSIAQLDDYRSHKAGAAYHLELPTYQRGLVWPMSKKTSLIRSISNEYPIGALLLYEKETGQSTKMLQVIDGLQRSTAILEYLKNPLLVAPVADSFVDTETYEELDELLSEIGISTKIDALKNLVKAWAEDTKTTKVVDGFTATSLRKKFEEHFEVIFEAQHRETIEEVLNEGVIQKLTDTFQRLRDYQIPVILYSGAEDALPEIFESLNSGTPLTKYDKFGATWSGHKTITKTKEVRDAVAERYKVYVEKDWDVANFDPSTPLGEDELNLFEYLVGLGHVLSDKNPSLFPSAPYENEAPSSAFALATLCHGLRLGDMDKLPTKLRNDDGTPINLGAFQDALLDSAAIVNNQLDKYLSLKLNAKSASARFIPHSDLQVSSLIARVAIEKYDPSTWRPRASSQITELTDDLLSHYFFDILKENWKGSGDSTAFNRVWEEDASKALVRASYYLQKPTAEDFESALDEFHASELKKAQFDRPNISSKTKVLLRALYADMITHLDSKSVQFEIEHLFPVKALNEVIQKSDPKVGLPISAFGNLAILSQTNNVIKGKNFIGDFVVKSPAKVTDPEKVKKYVITPLDEITKAKLDSGDAYVEFCKNRFSEQKAVILKNLGY